MPSLHFNGNIQEGHWQNYKWSWECWTGERNIGNRMYCLGLKTNTKSPCCFPPSRQFIAQALDLSWLTIVLRQPYVDLFMIFHVIENSVNTFLSRDIYFLSSSFIYSLLKSCQEINCNLSCDILQLIHFGTKPSLGVI